MFDRISTRPPGRRIHRGRTAKAWLLAAAVLICSGGASFAAKPAASPAPSATPALDMTQYKGKVVYVDFWASWCGPCKLSFPYMERLSHLPKSNFVLIAVNVDHQKNRADDFLRQFSGAVPVVFDQSGAIATQFNVKAMPTSFLIGKDGKVRFVHDGFFPGQIGTYDTQIQELLNEK